MESFKKALREDFEKVLDANRRKPDTLITILYILVLNSSKLKLPVDLLEPLMDVIIEDENVSLLCDETRTSVGKCVILAKCLRFLQANHFYESDLRPRLVEIE